MIVTSHQPIFLPWPGLFYKAMKSDCLVLLDDVQFPRGRGWVNRNRLKNDQGTLWLTVPVFKKGCGFQAIRDVRIYDGRNWRDKHLRSIQQNYGHAPYYKEYWRIIDHIYKKRHDLLMNFNTEFIRFLWDALSLEKELLLQTELGIKGNGAALIIKICKHLGADRYLIFPTAEKHLDVGEMKKHGIELVFAPFHPPVYPQLWGDFIYNLSTLDLLLNCGPKSKEILAAA